jgi:hypothetical protein
VVLSPILHTISTIRHIGAIGAIRLKPLMRAPPRRAIVLRPASAHLRQHAIRIAQLHILRHAVVRAVELHVRNAIIPLDTGCLLQPLRDVIANLAEDGDLSLEGLLVLADGHLAGDVIDEALFSAVIEDVFPKGAWGIEVFGTYLRKEGDSIADEVSRSMVRSRNLIGSMEDR